MLQAHHVMKGGTLTTKPWQFWNWQRRWTKKESLNLKQSLQVLNNIQIFFMVLQSVGEVARTKGNSHYGRQLGCRTQWRELLFDTKHICIWGEAPYGERTTNCISLKQKYEFTLICKNSFNFHLFASNIWETFRFIYLETYQIDISKFASKGHKLW